MKVEIRSNSPNNDLIKFLPMGLELLPQNDNLIFVDENRYRVVNSDHYLNLDTVVIRVVRL